MMDRRTGLRRAKWLKRWCLGWVAAVAVAGLPEGCANGGLTGNQQDSSVEQVAGNISVPTKWGGSTKVYVIESSIQVSSPLTIDAGTIVKFAADYGITLEPGGTIKAVGTSAYPIIFTSYKDDAHGGDTDGDGSAFAPSPGDWGGITTNGQNGSIFNFCDFFYGGNASGGSAAVTISAGSTNTQVTNSLFADNDGGSPLLNEGALNASAAGNGTVIHNDLFYGNQTPLAIGPQVTLDDSNIFHDPKNPATLNQYQAVAVTGGAGVSGNITWDESEVALVVSDYLAIEGGASLTLGPNVVVKSGPNVEIDVDAGGNLTFDSTDIFTSYRDDTRGGDSDGDSNAIMPAAGDWVGIYDYNAAVNNWLTGTDILYALN